MNNKNEIKKCVLNKDNLINKLYNIKNIFIDIEHFNKQEILNFNNIELKINCYKYSLNSTGTKCVLVERLLSLFNNNEIPVNTYFKQIIKNVTNDVNIANIPNKYNPDKIYILRKIIENKSVEYLIDLIFPYVNIFLDIKICKLPELNNFSRLELEYNCQKFLLKSNGSKSVLVERLESVINNNIKEEYFLKKRGRKIHNIDDSLNIMIKNENNRLNRKKNLLNDNMNNLKMIYTDIDYNVFNKKTVICNNKLYISCNKNVYNLENNTYIYIGFIENNKIVI